MIYNNSNSFQKRFVTGRFTLTMLLVGATLLWIIGVLGQVTLGDAPTRSLLTLTLPVWLEGLLSFGLYVATAFILNSFVIIEGRTPWLGGLFMWLTACLISLQCNVVMALSVLVFVLLIALLMACYPRGNIQRWVYSVFLLLSLSSLFMPQYVYMFPLAIIYIAMSGLLGVRNILAALLGVLTPLWFLYGFMTLFPDLALPGGSLLDALYSVLQFSFAMPPLPMLLLMAVEAVVLLSAAVVFVGSSSPAKPLMRRMLLFIICANVYLWLLAWFAIDSVELLTSWRLAGLAIIVAYIFSLRFNRLYNISFWIFNIMWIAAAAVFDVWIWIF